MWNDYLGFWNKARGAFKTLAVAPRLKLSHRFVSFDAFDVEHS